MSAIKLKLMPYDMGLKIGSTFKNEITYLASLSKPSVVHRLINRFKSISKEGEYLKFISRLDGDLFSFLKGMAVGSNVAVESIIRLNLSGTQFLNATGLGIIIPNEFSNSDGPLIGQNLDVSSDLPKPIAPVRYYFMNNREAAGAQVSFYPGLCSAIFIEKFAIALIPFPTRIKFHGLDPFHLTLRVVLHAKSLEQAIKIIQETPKAGAQIHMLVDMENNAKIIESSPDSIKIKDVSKMTVVGAYPESPEIKKWYVGDIEQLELEKQKVSAVQAIIDSNELLGPGGLYDILTLTKSLGNEGKVDLGAICKAGGEKTTVFSSVFEVAEKMWLFNKAPCSSDYERIWLEL